MFVAQREIKVAKREGGVIVYKAGDAIPDFEKWDIIPKRAHLNLEWVKWVEEGKLVSKSETKRVDALKAKQEPKKSPKKAEAKETTPPDLWVCPKCPTREFNSQRAMRTHYTISHGK